jgi:hypothetical protein
MVSDITTWNEERARNNLFVFEKKVVESYEELRRTKKKQQRQVLCMRVA